MQKLALMYRKKELWAAVEKLLDFLVRKEVLQAFSEKTYRLNQTSWLRNIRMNSWLRVIMSRNLIVSKITQGPNSIVDTQRTKQIRYSLRVHLIASKKCRVSWIREVSAIWDYSNSWNNKIVN